MRQWHGWLAGAALALAAATPADAQSLYRERATAVSLFTDHRAHAVNDIVTILIVEQSSSAREANTKIDKTTSRKASVSVFPTVWEQLARFVVDDLKLDMSQIGAHEGRGNIDRSDTVTGRIPAKVVKVLENGNMVLEGRRAVLVNNETQVITLSGIIRPQDVTGGNTVLSSQVADAEIQMVGRGVLAEAQRPGILYRFLDWLHLF
jgi:flagellar L-ring protein precursor FlgH